MESTEFICLPSTHNNTLTYCLFVSSIDYFVRDDSPLLVYSSLHPYYNMSTHNDNDRDSMTVLRTASTPSSSGRPFDIYDCRDCDIALVDSYDQIQIDDATGCRIFVGACSDSIFVRNCRDCTLTVACKQLRTRDCENCTINLYCKTEPVIETSRAMR